MPAHSKRIRDIERSLKRKGLDAEIVASLQEKLEKEKARQNVQKKRLLEQEYATKYHQV